MKRLRVLIVEAAILSLVLFLGLALIGLLLAVAVGGVGPPHAAHAQVRVQHAAAPEPEQVVLAARLHGLDRAAGHLVERGAIRPPARLGHLAAREHLAQDRGGPEERVPLRHRPPRCEGGSPA